VLFLSPPFCKTSPLRVTRAKLKGRIPFFRDLERLTHTFNSPVQRHLPFPFFSGMDENCPPIFSPLFREPLERDLYARRPFSFPVRDREEPAQRFLLRAGDSEKIGPFSQRGVFFPPSWKKGEAPLSSPEPWGPALSPPPPSTPEGKGESISTRTESRLSGLEAMRFFAHIFLFFPLQDVDELKGPLPYPFSLRPLR